VGSGGRSGSVLSSRRIARGSWGCFRFLSKEGALPSVFLCIRSPTYESLFFEPAESLLEYCSSTPRHSRTREGRTCIAIERVGLREVRTNK
jgi:hypothetical protein